jgi:transcriptional regulator with PAS, ATPase and Fis domain
MTAANTSKVSFLEQKLRGKHRYGCILGKSPSMQKIYQLLENIKDSDSTVLISGKTGTGKELIAHTIHANSSRKDSPMVTVNCGAIPKALMEREFFGHIKGAYTGAISNKKGYFEEADGGTLFLDEIGEMDWDIQVKLLRVLERGEIIRVGDSSPTSIDVRLIAATNKDLRAEVRNRKFREDLYYRIYVIPLHIPPLKERREDIPILIENFIKNFQSKRKKDIPSLSEKAMEMLINYSYPGNVRELENLIERYCLLGTSIDSLLAHQSEEPCSSPSEFPYDELLSSSNPLKTVAQKAKTHAEREFISHVLKLCNNDYTETAKMLNISLSSLYRKLQNKGEHD